MKRLMLLGAPGVGKGTYARLLSKELQLPVLTVGDLVRAEIKAKTVIGNQMASFSRQGKLVPDDIIVEVVRNEVKKHGDGVILVINIVISLPQRLQ